jgi:hypothetical protein
MALAGRQRRGFGPLVSPPLIAAASPGHRVVPGSPRSDKELRKHQRPGFSTAIWLPRTGECCVKGNQHRGTRCIVPCVGIVLQIPHHDIAQLADRSPFWHTDLASSTLNGLECGDLIGGANHVASAERQRDRLLLPRDATVAQKIISGLEDSFRCSGPLQRKQQSNCDTRGALHFIPLSTRTQAAACTSRWRRCSWSRRAGPSCILAARLTLRLLDPFGRADLFTLATPRRVVGSKGRHAKQRNDQGQHSHGFPQIGRIVRE